MNAGKVLDIAVRSMQTYQRAIDVASHNISNADNTDYTRKKVVLASVVAENGLGAGVKVQNVQRVRNELTDAQIRKYQSQYSEANTKTSYLSQIETLISEPSSSGLSTYFSNFFNNWNQLTTNPNSTQLRLSIVQSAQQLSESIKETISGLNDIQSTVQKETATIVNEINNDLKEISSLNKQIYELDVQGYESSDLKDQRDKVINNLSELININVQTTDQDVKIVSVGGLQGAELNNSNEFEMKVIDGKLKMVYKSDQSTGAFLTGGKLAAFTDLYSNKIPSYIAKYEQLATEFAKSVNEIHKTGYTLIQNGSSSTNINFFGEYDASGNLVVFDNGELIINPDILNNPQNIAASDTADNDGNSSIAAKISQLSDAKIPALNNHTIIEDYNSILSTIGSDIVLSKNTVESTSLVLDQLNTQKSSETGVSLDEEMTKVLVYQRAYQAASKLINVADELMQTILSIVR